MAFKTMYLVDIIVKMLSDSALGGLTLLGQKDMEDPIKEFKKKCPGGQEENQESVSWKLLLKMLLID